MRYTSLACDFDGTLAEYGKISGNTLAALARLKASGRKVILVTGRVLDDLIRTFPDYAICDRIVAENGALLQNPSDHCIEHLAPQQSPAFIKALLDRKVVPLEIGWSIVGAQREHEAAVLEAIAEEGPGLRPIYNKDSIMILPAGVDKGTGLQAALVPLGLSAEGAVGVGDAENDFALLGACGCGVAVANALPGLKDAADIVTKAAAGAGVEELIERLLLTDLADVPVRGGLAAS
jgi:hypothetical protein